MQVPSVSDAQSLARVFDLCFRRDYVFIRKVDRLIWNVEELYCLGVDVSAVDSLFAAPSTQLLLPNCVFKPYLHTSLQCLTTASILLLLLKHHHTPPSSTSKLPLCLLPPHKLLQYRHPLLQRLQPLQHLRSHLGRIIPQLGIKVLSIRTRTHRSAEDGFYEEAVVRLERIAVGGAERGGEFFSGVREVLAEGLCCEVETAVKGMLMGVLCME